MTKIVSIVLIILVILGVLYFVLPDSMRFWEGQTASVIDSVDNSQDQSAPDRITAKHQYKSGTHIVAGVVDLPTPCYILSTSARVAESYPEQVTIDFRAETSGEVCIQVITSERFKIDFQASEQAQIKATWNGQPVELNLIEAS